MKTSKKMFASVSLVSQSPNVFFIIDDILYSFAYFQQRLITDFRNKTCTLYSTPMHLQCPGITVLTLIIVTPEVQICITVLQ